MPFVTSSSARIRSLVFSQSLSKCALTPNDISFRLSGRCFFPLKAEEAGGRTKVPAATRAFIETDTLWFISARAALVEKPLEHLGPQNLPEA